MPLKISHDQLVVNGFLMHYVSLGSGYPIVLLHGWPQTWYEWRNVIPALAQGFRVIAPDLRGLGDSGKPSSGYDKRTLASDVSALLSHLGCPEVGVIGHDWGGSIAYYLAHDNPGLVARLMVLDMVPSLFRAGDDVPLDAAISLNHVFFHGGDPDWAEHLISLDIAGYLRRFFTGLQFNYSPSVFSESDIAEYVRVNSLPGAVRAGCSWYATGLREDAVNCAAITTRLTMPVEVYSSAALGDLCPAWRAVADDVSGHAVDRCGHFIPEERPDFVIEKALRFFDPLRVLHRSAQHASSLKPS